MINLYVAYFRHGNISRRRELDLCLNRNFQNSALNVVVIDSQNKITYNKYFDVVRKYTSDSDINIIANLDIYFDDTIKLCEKIGDNDFLSLLRYEDLGNRVGFRSRGDSQDVWIFRGEPKNINGDFLLGYPGCDNKIAYEASKVGYNVKNPCLSIKTYHVHNTQIRDYVHLRDTIPGPYITVEPCSL